jgi:hypothetical protein
MQPTLHIFASNVLKSAKMRVKINMTSNLDIYVSKKVSALKSIFRYNLLSKESEANFKGSLVNF